jgi:hypothetical protein
MSGAGAGRVGMTMSSVSNTAWEVDKELLHHQQRWHYVINPFMGSPPEMGNDDDISPA